MTYGEQIKQGRERKGLTQEQLAESLEVSRQAVSKWETNAATPDMANLIALAQEFGVSVAELTETPEPSAPPPEPAEIPAPRRRAWLWYLLLALLFAVLIGGLTCVDWYGTLGQSDEPARDPMSDPASDFALTWVRSDDTKPYVELGTQETFFPFGTSLELTEPEEVQDTDFLTVTAHRADCGTVLIEYRHIDEDLELDPEMQEREVIDALSTISHSVATPRGIGPGSSEAALLAAYADELVFCLKEEGDSLVPHDYYYAWSAFVDGYFVILFYMERGQVTGIRMEALGELGDFYAPDNISRFPMKNGEPDFSLREEPEREVLTDTRRVYIAFNQLVTNDNLTAEEQYAYRRDIFAFLPDLDWSELMEMGTAEYPEDTFFALLNWLERQDGYTASEIFHIQWGCTARGLDGACTDAYCELLSHVLFYDPVRFAKNLALEGPSEEEKLQILRHTAYDAEWHPMELEAALETLDDALNGGRFTETEAGWAKLLRLYLTTPIDERNDLPKSPSELS